MIINLLIIIQVKTEVINYKERQKDLRVTYNVYNHLDDKRVRMEMQRLGMIDAEQKVDPVTFGDNLVTN